MDRRNFVLMGQSSRKIFETPVGKMWIFFSSSLPSLEAEGGGGISLGLGSGSPDLGPDPGAGLELWVPGGRVGHGKR